MNYKAILFVLGGCLLFGFLGTKCSVLLTDYTVSRFDNIQFTTDSMATQFNQMLFCVIAFGMYPIVVYLLILIFKKQKQVWKMIQIALLNLVFLFFGIVVKLILVFSALDKSIGNTKGIPEETTYIQMPTKLLDFGTYAIYGLAVGAILSLFIFKRKKEITE